MFNSTPDDLDMHVVYDVSHNIAKVRFGDRRGVRIEGFQSLTFHAYARLRSTWSTVGRARCSCIARCVRAATPMGRTVGASASEMGFGYRDQRVLFRPITRSSRSTISSRDSRF